MNTTSTMTMNFTMTTELCPHCNNEIEIPATFKPHICPDCKHVILPCSLCDMDSVNCSKCPLQASVYF